jgi:hypothetical protein
MYQAKSSAPSQSFFLCSCLSLMLSPLCFGARATLQLQGSISSTACFSQTTSLLVIHCKTYCGGMHMQPTAHRLSTFSRPPLLIKFFGSADGSMQSQSTCCTRAQSSVIAAFACSMTAGACCVGMRTSVWGNGGPSSAFFSDSSSSFAFESFADVV